MVEEAPRWSRWVPCVRSAELSNLVAPGAPKEVSVVETDARRRRVVKRPFVWFVAVSLPILVFMYTQLSVVQNADGWLVHELTAWDLGKKDVLADIFAPMWIVSIIVMSAFNRRLLARYGAASNTTERPGIERHILTTSRVRRSTWVVTIGAVLILAMSWTREWARFGEQPDAFWYVSVIVVVLVLLIIPVWWVRHGLYDDIHDAISGSRAAATLDSYLFSTDDAGRSRWLLVLAFSAISAVVAWTAMGQFDALLQGMHRIGGASVGIGGLTSVLEFDLSHKPLEIVERVGIWASYSSAIGPEFASGLGVAGLYLGVETFVLIPAYTIGIGTLLLHVRRTQPEDLSEDAARSYQLLIGAGLGMLAVLTVSDVLGNAMMWFVVRDAWLSPEVMTTSTVRVMWFATVFRMVALGSMIAVGVLIMAFRVGRYRWLADTLVAVRGQILVIVFVALALGMAQTEDVVRRWTVSVAFLTVAMVTALAVLIRWTSSRALAMLRDQSLAVSMGSTIEPAIVRMPFRRTPVSMRRVVVYGIFSLALVQVALVGVFGVSAGLGFIVPSVMIVVLVLFGVPLPQKAFERGDRHVDDNVKKWVPRLLGSSLYVVLGLVVLRSAVAQLVFARHGDPWLVFCLIPIIVGTYRIHTRTWTTMGATEFAVIGGVGVFGVVLWISQGNPQLSPVALTFVALMITYGSMAFYYSYEPESMPSRLVGEQMLAFTSQPLLLVGSVIAAVAGVALVIAPLSVAGRLGTVAVVLLGAMLFAGFAAASVRFAERTRPPKILAAFRLKRTPVFLLLFVWLAFAGAASTGASNDVALIESTVDESERSVTVTDVWDRWVNRNARGADTDEVIPIIFIASSGGGMRAAAWTSYVMDCLFVNSLGVKECTPPHDGPRSIAIMSGVSGGSLGLATFTASVLDPPDGEDGDWIKTKLGDDYLASTMAWLLLVDTPRSFIGFGPAIRDRAEIMALGWEASWKGDNGKGYLSEGMFEQWHRNTDIPLMVFNGTSVNDPCRFNGSVLRSTAHGVGDTCTSLGAFEGRTEGVGETVALAATQDLEDYLCGHQDVKVSTVVLMSARFPVITPSGRIGGGLGECDREPNEAFVVDGGYLDGSGAGTITELWQRLEGQVAAFNSDHSACIVPLLIQIDNGYENPRAAVAGTSPIEILVPLRTILSSQFGRIANEREQAAIEFDQPFELQGRPIRVYASDGSQISSRYARLTTRAHPGIQAPLGWTLSDASFDDLREQLTIAENMRELAEIQRWLTGDLTCEKPS